MNANTQHTPGPLKVLFGGQTCSLYFDKHGDERAKDRLVQLPRDSALGDTDPNVQFVRILAAAPDGRALIEKILAADASQFGSAKQFQAWCALVAKPYLAKATGAA